MKLPILLRRTQFDAPLRTETVDISNNGFFCNTAQPFAPGEKVTCLISLPTQTAEPGCMDRLYLLADVEVVRIVVNNETGFGVGCRISGYRILRNGVVPFWAAAQAERATALSGIEQLV